MNNNIIIFDGAMGSEIQKTGYTGSPEALNLENNDLIASIHKRYIQAGADIISTNTFGANKYKLSQYGLGEKVSDIIESAFFAAKNAGQGLENKYKIALDVGPTGKLLKPYGDAYFDEIYDVYKECALTAKKLDLDYIILETFSQLSELRAAFLAFKENTNIPIICSMTFEESGRSLTGVNPSSFAVTMERMGAFAVGANCSVGPDKLKYIIEEIRKNVSIKVLSMPNAGLPKFVDGKTIYDLSAESFAEQTKEAVLLGADIIGGCCGTTPEYIKELRKNIEIYNSLRNSREKEDKHETGRGTTYACSSKSIVPIKDNIIVVGERINPTGRKIMRESLKNEDYSVIYKEAIAQEEAGSDVLDVNVSVPGLDEVNAMEKVIMELQSIVSIPLQIDSTNPKVLERALRLYDGVAIVNSVDAKDEALENVLPLVKKYGANIIGLTTEKDIPKTAKERWQLAEKIINKAKEYGIDKERIFIDSLTLTASAAQENVFDTLECLKIAKDNGIKTVLGVSNVSFGLPTRKVLNSTFLAMAFSYGLNLAIINPLEKNMIDTVKASKVILNLDKGCNEYISWVKNENNEVENTKGTTNSKVWTLEECIIKGIKEDALVRLKEIMDKESSVNIVDDYIVPSLKIVGDMYEKGDIYLPQLLQSAEVVQTLFTEIKKTISISSGKGKIVIATVHGDIHDIGKNIVKVMLQNNGYDVIDLGSDVEPERVVEAVKKHQAKLVGLSALMTTTIPAMEKTIKLLRENELQCKILVGGAVLTRSSAKEIGADFYGKDAVESVKIANEVFS